jgi:hypothetical protein
MGSGFYEAPTGSSEVPGVLLEIAEALQDEGLLTGNPEVDVYVNPRACQAVAPALPAFAERGWTVRRAYKHEDYFGEGTDRSLHAKFLLSGNDSGRSNKCSSPWIYLGSANLTAAGFTRAMSREGGNLEAGIVPGTEVLYWSQTKAYPPELVLPNLLPVRWEEEDILVDETMLACGPEFTVTETLCVAPPISCLFWRPAEEGGILTPPDGQTATIEVMNESGEPCRYNSRGGFRWTGGRPRLVRVRWTGEKGQEEQDVVPVLDEFGRVAATSLRAIGIDEAWQQLDSFPMAPEDLDDELTDSRVPGNGIPHDELAHSGGSGVYPVRGMMQLVERVALRQTTVGKPDWIAWCIRLEQTLARAGRSGALQEFMTLGINPLSPLRHAPFRPAFAETDSSPEGARYEAALSRVEACWGVDGFAAIGGGGNAK